MSPKRRGFYCGEFESPRILPQLCVLSPNASKLRSIGIQILLQTKNGPFCPITHLFICYLALGVVAPTPINLICKELDPSYLVWAKCPIAARNIDIPWIQEAGYSRILLPPRKQGSANNQNIAIPRCQVWRFCVLYRAKIVFSYAPYKIMLRPAKMGACAPCKITKIEEPVGIEFRQGVKWATLRPIKLSITLSSR